MARERKTEISSLHLDWKPSNIFISRMELAVLLLSRTNQDTSKICILLRYFVEIERKPVENRLHNSGNNII